MHLREGKSHITIINRKVDALCRSAVHYSSDRLLDARAIMHELRIYETRTTSGVWGFKIIIYTHASMVHTTHADRTVYNLRGAKRERRGDEHTNLDSLTKGEPFFPSSFEEIAEKNYALFHNGAYRVVREIL